MDSPTDRRFGTTTQQVVSYPIVCRNHVGRQIECRCFLPYTRYQVSHYNAAAQPVRAASNARQSIPPNSASSCDISTLLEQDFATLSDLGEAICVRPWDWA